MSRKETMKGNKNAEKWDKETVMDLFDKMVEKVKEDKCYYVGWLLDEFDLYPDWWQYIQRKYEGDRDVNNMVKRIEQKLERNLLESMLTGKVKETTGIFTLKSKHQWKDRQDHHVEIEPIRVTLNLGKDS